MEIIQFLICREKSANFRFHFLSIQRTFVKCAVGALLACLAYNTYALEIGLYGVQENAEIHLARGDNYLSAKEYDKAISEYTRAIELKPDLAEAYNNRAYASYSKYDGSGDPLGDLNHALELKPNFPHAFNTRGCVYMAAGYPDKAIADFNRAIELQPDYPRAYRNRANAYLRKGHISLAIKDFETAGSDPRHIILYGFISIAMLISIIGLVTRQLISRQHKSVMKKYEQSDLRG